MTSPHQIDYENLPPVRRENNVAIQRAVSLSERELLAITQTPPLNEALVPVVMMPESGLIDFGKELGLRWPATLPDLLAGSVSLAAGDSRVLGDGAGGLVMLVLAGGGKLNSEDETLALHPGDISCLPGNQGITLVAGDQGLRYFFVDDSPLLNYLGWQVAPNKRSALTHFPAELLKQKLDEYGAAGIDASGVFLSHAGLADEKLCTPLLFAHLNRLMPGARNTVHAHAAPALTYVIDGGEQCYSLLGEVLINGEIQNPTRVEWQAGQLAITPPNLWHGHFNDGPKPVLSLVIQPAGLHYHNRTMNFQLAD